jgi:hypothetical protein
MRDLVALLGLNRPERAPVVPIANMIALWQSAEDTHTVTKVRVMDTHDQTDATAREYFHWDGCGDMRWLAQPLCTPIGVFMQLLVHGFANREVLLAALYQFRNVEGQRDWTTQMLFQLDDPNIERIVDEEELAEEGSIRPQFEW